METLIEFLIKASAGIALFYMVYWFFLRKETFFAANRWFLLGGLISATLLPLFPFHYTMVSPGQNTPFFTALNTTLKNIEPGVQENLLAKSSFTWKEVVVIAYLAGVSIFLFRVMVQSLTIVTLAIRFRIKTIDGIKVVENDKYGLPFSFFNLVFINPKFHKQDDLPEIIAHEKVHIRELHWADLLITELLTVIFWFNPFVWFVEHAIKQNHEYLADSGVISRGHSVGRYQALLVNQLMGMQIIGVTNNLNFALNTNRFKMMTKKKTPKIKAIKYGWALPVLAILLAAFAEPSYKTTTGKTEKTVIGSNLPVPEGFKVAGFVADKNGEGLPGASIIVKNTTQGTTSGKDGKFSIEIPGKGETVLVISFVGLKTTEVKVSADDPKSKKIVVLMEKELIGIDPEIYSDQYLETPPPPPPPVPVTPAKNEKELFVIVEAMPEYPGGTYALGKYIKKMTEKFVSEKNFHGKAVVNFTVGTDGKVTNIAVVEKDNDNVAKAATVIVSKMEDWKPGSQHGKTVPVDFSLPIEF